MNCTTEEKKMLLHIMEHNRFPIVRFELRNSKERSIISTALNYVVIVEKNDTMETVKKRGDLLKNLENMGLVTINFNLVVTAASDYKIFAESTVYQSLCALVEEGKTKDDFIFDTAYIKRGQVHVTSKGEEILKNSND